MQQIAMLAFDLKYHKIQAFKITKHENIPELAPIVEDNNYPTVFMTYVYRGGKLSINCNIC